MGQALQKLAELNKMTWVHGPWEDKSGRPRTWVPLIPELILDRLLIQSVYAETSPVSVSITGSAVKKPSPFLTDIFAARSISPE